MSYILEALKRAERERRAGSQSLLDEIPAATPPVRTLAWQRWIIAAVAAAILILALLIWLILGRHAASPTQAVSPQTTLSAVPPASQQPRSTPDAGSTALISQTTAAQNSARARIEPPQPDAIADADTANDSDADNNSSDADQTSTTEPAAVEDDGQINNLDDLADSPARGRAASSASSRPPAPAFSARSARPNVAAGAATTTAEKNNDGSAGSSRAIGPSTDDNDSNDDQPATAVAQASPAGAGKAESLRQMPDAYRASFPQLTVDVHAYSDVPAQRFVLIDGKRYREGDTLAQGPRVYAIVQEGIVFDWQGQRVLYALSAH